MKKRWYNNYGKSVASPTEEKLKAKIINKKVVIDEFSVCCGDKNSNRICFEIPCKVEDVNLTSVPVYIKCENALGAKIKRKLQSVVSGDNLLIEWLLGAEETLVSGKLKCQISFETATGELVLNTEIFQLEIMASVSENGPKAIQEYNHITQMQNQLAQMFEVGLLPAVTSSEEGEVLTVNSDGAWQSKALPVYDGANENGVLSNWKEVTLSELQTYVKNSSNFGKIVKIVAISSAYNFLNGITVINGADLNLFGSIADEQGLSNYNWKLSVATGEERGTCITWKFIQGETAVTSSAFSLSNTHKFYVQA